MGKFDNIVDAARGVGRAAGVAGAASRVAMMSRKVGGNRSLRALLGNSDVAAKAAKKGDDVAKAAAKAANKGDDAADVAKAASRAGKKASKKGAKAGKKADVAADAAKTGDAADVAKRSKLSRIASSCANNPTMCVAGVGIVGYTAKKYIGMSEEEGKCLNTCYPEDWKEYREGEISEPNYKVIDGVSKDKSLNYSQLYEAEMDGDLCTPDNLEKEIIPKDINGCDTFCKKKCGFGIRDIVSESVEDVVGGAKDVALGVTDGVLKGSGIGDMLSWLPYVVAAICILYLGSLFV
jgi:hypothetical protein